MASNLNTTTDGIKAVMIKLSKYNECDLLYESADFLNDINTLSSYAENSLNEFEARKTLENILLSVNAIDSFTELLIQLFKSVFGLDYSILVNQALFLSIKTLFDILINSTDSSCEFGKELCKNEKFLRFCYKIIEELKSKCLDGTLSKQHYEFLNSPIITLYNSLLFGCATNIARIQRMKFIDLLKDFLNCKDEMTKIHSLLFIAHAANETQNKIFKTDHKSILILINFLLQTLKSKDETCGGFSLEELAKGIYQLSKNEDNKRLLVELKVLDVLKLLLEKESLKYKHITLSILWSLAFDETNRPEIYKVFGDKLHQLKTERFRNDLSSSQSFASSSSKTASHRNSISENTIKTVKKATDNHLIKLQTENNHKEKEDKIVLKNTVKVLDGLFWTLNGDSHKERSLDHQVSDPDSGTSNGKHIMISYSHENSKIVMEIYKALVKENYKLWIDTNNITDTDDIMEAMAQAVENSIAVIVCVSHYYKNSDSCRSEAQYAKRRKKPLIPVIVQEKYRPDGWLGICIVEKVYCDFMGKKSFMETVPTLISNLEKVMKSGVAQNVDVNDSIKPTTAIKLGAENSKQRSIRKWTNEEVMEWFRKIGIKKVNWKSHYTGRELEFLRNVSKAPGETFYQISKTDLDLFDLKDLRILYEKLQKL